VQFSFGQFLEPESHLRFKVQKFWILVSLFEQRRDLKADPKGLSPVQRRKETYAADGRFKTHEFKPFDSVSERL
jgi:hypothetical protein